MRLWDVEREACVGEVQAHAAALRALRFKGGNNNRLLSASNDRTACLSDPRAAGGALGSAGAARAGGGFSAGSGLVGGSGHGGLLRFHGHAAPVRPRASATPATKQAPRQRD